MADWLRCWQVERAGMEATSDYWKPVYFLLEREGFDCLLYQASQVKALPGRPKTDLLDSAWLARITEQGSLAAGSFVPPEDIRRLRTHTRYRRRLIPGPHRREAFPRCEKLLEDAHLKLSSVISGIHGVSGRDMLRAIIAGERDPEVLAQMARTRMRRKIAQLREALDCSFFTGDHAFVLQMMLDNIDHATARITVLDERIAVLCEPYERQVAQLDGIPGFGVTNAQDLIGEIGVDMGAFPTAGHLCSWARLAPGVRESAGRRKEKNATGLAVMRHRQNHSANSPPEAGHRPSLSRPQRPATVHPHAGEKSPGRDDERPACHRPRPPVRPRGRVPRSRRRATTSSASAPGAARAATSAASSASATRSPSSPSHPRPTPKPAS